MTGAATSAGASGVEGAAELVARRRVVACVGPGGVGKTTLAAALALGAARRGRRALVVTVDPARRLADALGLPALDDQPRRVPVSGAAGALWALMLDSRRTYDALVARLAPNADTRARIHANPIYQRISRALAGSVEYAAMLKVFELQSRADLDLVVVDTPPSAHALDFLDAPARLLRLLDSPALQWLVNPALRAGRLGWRWFRRGGQQVLRALERVTGLAFLEDLSEFLLAFEGMSGGFRQRARAVQQLLFGPDCAFVLASGPGELAAAQARDFLARLEERGAHPQGVVLNRLRTLPGPGGLAEAAEGAKSADAARAALRDAFAARFGAEFPADEAAAASLRLWRNAAEAAAQDAAAAAPLLADAERLGAFARRIPEFAADVHDLAGLAIVEQHLFADRESQNRHAGGGAGNGAGGASGGREAGQPG
ncbi:MAG: AAA family ATPase [Deltaproteobacteria bacterium]|nr:AAA family ATPase [Deltaproteobacteria bacterium]